MALSMVSCGTSGVRPALFMIKLAALITLKRCSHRVTIHVLLSVGLNWSNSRNDCLLLDGWVEISSPARKLVPM